MAKKVSDLRTTNKTASTSSQYLFVSDISTSQSTKIALDDVFPSLQSGAALGTVSEGTTGKTLDLFIGGGVGSASSNTNKSILIFRGLRALDDTGSQTNALSARIDTSTADPNKQNITLKLDATKINAASLINTTSKFISEVGGTNALSLTNGGTQFNGTLPVAYGGTGKVTFTQNELLYGNGTSAIGTVRLTKGDLLSTNTGGGAPQVLSVGTNGYVLQANSAQTLGLEWVDGSSLFTGGTLSSNLNLGGNDILLNGGKLTNTGTGGINIASATGKVYLGAGTPSYPDTATVDGNVAFIANSSSTLYVESHDELTPPELTVHGSDAQSATGRTGGNLKIAAGDGDGVGDGGTLYLDGGVAGASGTHGDVVTRINGLAATTVDENSNFAVESGDVKIIAADKGLVHQGSGTVTQLSSFSTGVTINTTSGVITLNNASTLAGDATASFLVTNSTVTATSLVFLTLFDKTGASNPRYSVSLGNQAAGSFTVLLHNTENSVSTAGILRVNFLVVNV